MAKIKSRENVKIREEGTRLIIEVETDPEKIEPQMSSSGRTWTIGTTGGFRWEFGPDERIGINVTVSRRL